MERKVVFLDIDGTIWDYKGIIPESAKNAIRKLKEKGHILILCTGRAKGNVRDPELLALDFDGLIAACGCHVEYRGKMLYESFLPDETVRKIVETAQACNVPIVLEGNKKHWVSPHGFDHDEFVGTILAKLGEDAIPIHGYTPDMTPNKFAGDILVASDYKRFKALVAEELDFIDHDFDMVLGFSSEMKDADPNRIIGMFEGLSKGASKAYGIKVLCDYLQVDRKDTLAVGDSNNDLEMIRAVNIGICMGDGSAALKEVADYVTAPLWEDGLYKAMEHYGLI